MLNLADPVLTSFDNWLEAVCAMADGSTDNDPATTLVEFFKTDFRHMACGGVILDTARMRDVSPTLRRATAISDGLIASYIDYWRSIRFLE